jgi:hypothetical protein
MTRLVRSRMELMLLVLALVLLSLGILATVGSRPFTSDDVAQENAVTQLTFHSLPVIDLPQNSYLIKLPVYAVLNLAPLSPEPRLMVTVLILNLAGFALFYLAVRSIARAFQYLWLTVIIPFLWLCMVGYTFAGILANPNSRNLEVGLIFAALALMARWYRAEPSVRLPSEWAAATIFTAALGLLFYNDLWALTLFPRGCDQVIPQVLAVFLFYLSLVFPVGTTREGLLFGR